MGLTCAGGGGGGGGGGGRKYAKMRMSRTRPSEVGNNSVQTAGLGSTPEFHALERLLHTKFVWRGGDVP